MSHSNEHERAQAAAACPDCPLARRGLLSNMVGATKKSCRMPCVAVEARERVPDAWFERYAFAVVRRGYLVRERVDVDGRHTAVDAVGPGGYVPLRASSGPGLSAYGAGRVLLCVYPEPEIKAVPGSESDLADILSLQQHALDRMERIADARAKPEIAERIDALLQVAKGHANGEARPSATGLQQRDIAAILQIRPETVCRALRPAPRARDAKLADVDDRPAT